MTRRCLLVAIDRSERNCVEVFSIVVVSRKDQDTLLRYVDVFKHARKLDSIAKQVYLPKAISRIRKLVEEGVVKGLAVATKLDTVLNLLSNKLNLVLTLVVDDNVLNYYTVTGTQVKDVIKDVPLRITESILENPSTNIVRTVHGYGLKLAALRTINRISDNVAYYASRKVIDALTLLPRIWRV